MTRIAVLMATFNGVRWLPQQVQTILDQRDVDVRLIVSDDGSSDGTVEWLRRLGTRDARVILLPPMRSGGAAANFFRLLRDAELEPDELVALADQDDVWVPDKLARHAALLASSGAAAVSSNVVAFGESGDEQLVRKDYPQRRFDYLLESPGPGSTFLMTPRLVARVRGVLTTAADIAQVDYHDWLIYAVARAAGERWVIDGVPTVRYRQHGANVMGANVGVRSATSRLGLIRRRWHRSQAALLARIVGEFAVDTELPQVRALLDDRGVRARFALAARAGELRRRPRDRAAIAGLVLLGVW